MVEAAVAALLRLLPFAPRLALKGLGPRGLFGVLLVSLQFLFYAQLRGAFGVSKADLTLVLDALQSIQSFQ